MLRRLLHLLRARRRDRARERAFRAQFEDFARLGAATRARFPLSWEERAGYLDDATSETPFDAHYVYHPAWAARVLARTRPHRHVDVSSTLHFASIVSAFVPVDFYDIRPPRLLLGALTTGFADLCALPFPDRSVSSLSCMHSVEHVGLGRYGDALDYDGDLRAMAELRRVLAPGGDLLLVVPVGRPRVVFNAHRIYSHEQVLSCFAGLELRSFELIPDDAPSVGMLDDPPASVVNDQNYACGCYWFRG